MTIALTYTNIKGVFGAYTMLCGKMVSSLLVTGGQMGKWETYFFLVLFILFNLGMEYWRQKVHCLAQHTS